MAESSHIGIDIGTNVIKAVLLGVTKTGFVVEKLRVVDYDNKVTENGAIMDYGELVHRLVEIIDSSFPTKDVAIALKGPSVLVRKMLVNNDSLGELGEFRWIADQYAYVDPEEMCIDFEALPSQDLYNHTSIIMTAANKDVVTDFVSVIESARLVPRIIEPEAMSIARLYRTLHKNSAAKVNMVIHVGHIGSYVIFMKNGFFDFSREVSRGGKYFIEMIRHDLDVDEETAENIKNHPLEYEDQEKLTSVFERIFGIEYVKEIDYVVKFYMLRGGSLPDNIYLSGVDCQIPGLEKALREKYTVPVEFLDPWKVISLPDKVGRIKPEDRYSYSVVLGLALHGQVF